MCIRHSQSDNPRGGGHTEFKIHKQGVAVHVRVIFERVYTANGHSSRRQSNVPIMGAQRPFIYVLRRNNKVFLYPLIFEDSTEGVLQVRKLIGCHTAACIQTYPYYFLQQYAARWRSFSILARQYIILDMRECRPESYFCIGGREINIPSNKLDRRWKRSNDILGGFRRAT